MRDEPEIRWRKYADPMQPGYDRVKPPFTWRPHSSTNRLNPTIMVLCVGDTRPGGQFVATAWGILDLTFAPNSSPEERERQMQTVHDLCMVRWGDRT